MKNMFKLFGIIAMTVIMGFSFVSCGGTSSPADTGPARTLVPPPGTVSSAHIGESWNIGGPVRSWFTGFPLFTGNREVISQFTGGISNGEFSLNLTIPNTPSPIGYLITFLETEGFTNVTISDNTVEFYFFYYINITPPYFQHQRLLHEWRRTGIGANYMDRVLPFWVSGDITMTAYGFTEGGVTLNGINNLAREGWNAFILREREGLTTFTITFFASDDFNNFRWYLVP